jgi:hypothetical protein
MARARAALTILSAVLLAGCAGSASTSDSELRVTRADGTTVAFPRDARAWCGPWDEDVPTRALHVGTVAKPLGEASYWVVQAVPRDVVDGQRTRFPLDFVWKRPRGAVVFVLDLEDTRGGKNEASSQAERSSGWIEFDAVGCEVGDEVAFTADAVIASEFTDGEPIEFEGSLRLRAGRPPPGF